MRSNPSPARAASRNAAPPRNGARRSPPPSGGDSTVTSFPSARSCSTCARAYTPMPSCMGGYGATTRTFTGSGPPRLQQLLPALHRDVHLARVLLPPDHGERVVLLLQVVHAAGVPRVHPERDVVPPLQEREALEADLHPGLPFHARHPHPRP